MAQSREPDSTKIPQLMFRSDKYHNVTSLKIQKRFQVTSDKRRKIGNDTVPYGTKD